MTLDDRITAFLENRLGTAAQESARAEAAEAEAAECRAERAHYGDIMTSKLASAEARIVELEANVELLRAALADARSVLANLDDNLRLSRDTWTEWHSDVARQRISFVLPDDTSDQDAR
jgi:chromosome segregation ATPase